MDLNVICVASEYISAALCPLSSWLIQLSVDLHLHVFLWASQTQNGLKHNSRFLCISKLSPTP